MSRKPKKNYGLKAKINEWFYEKNLADKQIALALGGSANSLSEYISNKKRVCDSINRLIDGKKIARLKKEYSITGNPLIVWEAFLLCLENDYRIPSWINSYLKESAINLLNLTAKSRMAPEIASAIGLYTEGKGTIFSQLQDARLRFKAVEMIFNMKLKNLSKPLEIIFSNVATNLSTEDKIISNSTVEKWYHELKDDLG